MGIVTCPPRKHCARSPEGLRSPTHRQAPTSLDEHAAPILKNHGAYAVRELPALPRIVRQRINLAHRIRRLEGAESLPLILRQLGDHALHVLVLLARDLGALALLLLSLQRRGPCPQQRRVRLDLLA